MWFDQLTGFTEENPEQVRGNLEIKENKLISKVNGKEYVFGRLEVVSLEELRNTTRPMSVAGSKIQVSEVVGNIQDFHKDPLNEGAFFQAASQFNLLEMVGPGVTPERGVGIYENDRTQGPACAIACGAGTIYRNYFCDTNGETGQSRNNQIDCLKDIGEELENEGSSLWTMTNGYALANSKECLQTVSERIKSKSVPDYEMLKGKLKIGIQWDTEVTISESKHLVSQAYCSALPVSYSNVPPSYWEDFARLVLEATYEATFLAALLNLERTGNNKLFLTLVGGGAFGNKTEWIFDAIAKAVSKFAGSVLDVKIVSYGRSNPEIREFVKSIKV